MRIDTGSHRILYINKYASFPPLESGTHRSYFLMLELAKLGLSIDFVTSDFSHLNPRTRKPKLNGHSNLNVFFLKVPSFTQPSGFKRALGWLVFEAKVITKFAFSTKKFEFVIASSPSILTLLSGILLSKLKSSKLIVEIRDIWPLTLTEEGGFSKENFSIRVMQKIERLAFSRADLIVGTMPNLEAHVETVTSMHREVVCIPMGVDDELCEGKHSFAQSTIEESTFENFFTIAYAGTLGKTNPLNDFFEVAGDLLKDTGVKFLVIGGGPMLTSLIDRYKDLPNVIFSGPKPREETLKILKKCSILYFATYNSEIWRYGQSLNKVVDYMLSARPIIGSYSGFPSMINDANCGVFVAPGEAIALKNAIVEFRNLDKSTLDSIGARGKEWLCANRKYSYLSYQYAKILKSL
jgi:glycosyltransferase involved in cell wall biosynthesis